MSMSKPVYSLTILILLTFCINTPATSRQMPAVNPNAVDLDSQQLSVIDRIIEDEITKGRLAGAVALVARRGKIAYHEAFGYLDLETMRPMNRDAIFRTMSISKSMTSIGVMKLQEAGLIRIDDPIGMYIPAFANQEVAIDFRAGTQSRVMDKQITIRHLLTHRAGMPYLFFPDAPLSQLYIANNVGGFDIFGYDETIGEYVQRLAALPRFDEPGGDFAYGYATDVLGYLIEVVSGMPLDQYLDQHIFEPLGMSDTGFYISPDDLYRFPSVYISTPAGGLDLLEAYDTSAFVQGPRKILSGAAGVTSTAYDFALFCQMILDQGKAGRDRIVSRKTIETMTSNHLGEGYIMDGFRFWGDKFGLGFGIRTERGEYDDLESLGTLAFSGVYFPKFWIDPEEEMIVIFFTQLLPYDADYRGVAARVKNAAFASIDD